MCIAFIVLLLENSKLFYVLLLFCLYIEILAVSSWFKCLIAMKCSESRVETLQIFLCCWRCFIKSCKIILSFIINFFTGPISFELAMIIVLKGINIRFQCIALFSTLRCLLHVWVFKTMNFNFLKQKVIIFLFSSIFRYWSETNYKLFEKKSHLIDTKFMNL